MCACIRSVSRHVLTCVWSLGLSVTQWCCCHSQREGEVSRPATRKSDILYTYSVVAFGLALRFWAKEVWMNKRHDLCLIESLWVVTTQVRTSLTIFEHSSVTSSWLESSLKCSTVFKASFQKKTRGTKALTSESGVTVYKHCKERREERSTGLSSLYPLHSILWATSKR